MSTGSNYARFHQNRSNLLIHIFAVPLFVLGTLGAIWFLVTGQYVIAGALALLPPLSLAIQGAGHKLEPVPPLPFTGPVNFVSRILAEQFVRFPLYVLSGSWARALSGDDKQS